MTDSEILDAITAQYLQTSEEQTPNEFMDAVGELLGLPDKPHGHKS